MATPADVVAEAVALMLRWHEQAQAADAGAAGETSPDWPEAG